MDIRGVEIFSVGNWNGDEYSYDDLVEMVRAFNENKTGARPHLKLGHDEEQKLLQKDGLPAAGWVDRLYVRGDKLLADFVQIPKKVAELIKTGAYKKVSSEIFWNIKIKDKVYKRMLAAVALLGADNPGVMNLDDILAMYKKVYSDDLEKVITKEVEFKPDLKSANHKENEMEKTENEVKLEFSLQQKEADLKAADLKLKENEEALKLREQEIEDLKTFKIETEKKAQEAMAAAQVAKRDAFITELISDKLCTPAMKPFVAELLGEEKKEYSLKIGETESKFESKQELLKETLKLFKAAAEVNFDENSEAGDESSKDIELELHKKALEYAEEHKVTYSAALKQVRRQK